MRCRDDRRCLVERQVRALGRGEQAVDDVGELAAQPEPATLPRRRAAAAERHLRQLEHLLEVAERLQMRAQRVDQLPDEQHGGDQRGPGRVDQVALQARPRGTPGGRAEQLVADLRERDALHGLLPGPPHERAEQAGDQHDEVDLGAGVADAQLDGRHVGAGPDVEVDHPRVADRPRVDQVLDHRVVLGAGLHHRGRPRGRPAGPDQLAVARVAGVAAMPVGGAGRDGEQGGQVGGDAADDLHGLVAVRHVDVDLGAADVLLVDQHLVLVLHVREPRARRDVAPVDVDQRHRARRHHAEAVRFGGLGQPGPQPLQVRPQLVEGVAHRRVGLHQRSLQLGRELLAVELAQQRVDLGGGPPRLEVDDVELLLGPDLESPRLLMAATVGSACYAEVARGSLGVAAGAPGRLPACG